MRQLQFSEEKKKINIGSLFLRDMKMLQSFSQFTVSSTQRPQRNWIWLRLRRQFANSQISEACLSVFLRLNAFFFMWLVNSGYEMLMKSSEQLLALSRTPSTKCHKEKHRGTSSHRWVLIIGSLPLYPLYFCVHQNSRTPASEFSASNKSPDGRDLSWAKRKNLESVLPSENKTAPAPGRPLCRRGKHNKNKLFSPRELLITRSLARDAVSQKQYAAVGRPTHRCLQDLSLPAVGA